MKEKIKDISVGENNYILIVIPKKHFELQLFKEVETSNWVISYNPKKTLTNEKDWSKLFDSLKKTMITIKGLENYKLELIDTFHKLSSIKLKKYFNVTDISMLITIINNTKISVNLNEEDIIFLKVSESCQEKKN